MSFGLLHLGDHNVSGGIREFRDEEAYETLTREIGDVFKTADLPEVIRAVDKHFGQETYSLKLLFRDELRKILNMILDQNLSEMEGSHLQIYEQNATMMRFLSGMGIPLPDPLYAAAKVAINTELRRAVSGESLDGPSSTGFWKRAAVSGSRSIRWASSSPCRRESRRSRTTSGRNPTISTCSADSKRRWE